MADRESAPPRATLRHAGPTLARLAEGSAPGRLLVHVGDAVHPAITTVKLDAAAIRAALAVDQPVVVLFQDDDPARPIIVGLVQSESPTPMLDELLDGKAPASLELERPPAELPALVDGKRVVIDAKDELVLRCGKATITLRRNGKVVIRGTYVETHAEGVNRIKGGAVKIN